MISRCRTSVVTFAALVALTSPPAVAQRGANPAAAEAVKAKYQKLEVRIPMRDGVKLFTSSYMPRDLRLEVRVLPDSRPTP